MKQRQRSLRSSKAILSLLFCLTALSSAYVHALPTVESRTGQSQPVTHSDDYVEFHGGSKPAADEPLIPVSTSSTPYVEMNTVSPREASIAAPERAARLTLKEVESLQREVSQLRGIIETQEHEIKQLKKSQQDFYMDLDRRLSQLQNTSGSKANPAAAATKSAPKEGKNKTPAATLTDPLAKSPAPTSIKSSAAAPKSTEAAANKPMEQNLSKTNAPSQPIVTETQAANPAPKPSVNANVPATSTGNDENMSYQAAYNLVKTKRYEEAIQAFQKHLKQYPQGEHVANAHYWLGEVYMVQWQTDKSLESLDKAQNAFSNIAQGYPNHTKTADAVLKLGLIELDKGNQEAARQKLMEVKTRYPGTTAARVAESRLRQIP